VPNAVAVGIDKGLPDTQVGDVAQGVQFSVRVYVRAVKQ
jgi:hypothetical protein